VRLEGGHVNLLTSMDLVKAIDDWLDRGLGRVSPRSRPAATHQISRIEATVREAQALVVCRVRFHAVRKPLVRFARLEASGPAQSLLQPGAVSARPWPSTLDTGISLSHNRPHRFSGVFRKRGISCD
jgi:hypothetical protein